MHGGSRVHTLPARPMQTPSKGFVTCSQHYNGQLNSLLRPKIHLRNAVNAKSIGGLAPGPHWGPMNCVFIMCTGNELILIVLIFTIVATKSSTVKV